MGRLLRAALVATLALPLFVATGGRAIACSCAATTADAAVRRASAVVVGHIDAERPIDALHTATVVTVTGVYKGRVAPVITLTADLGNGGGSSCAVLYPVGETVDPLVLARHTDGTYEVQLCSIVSASAVRGVLGDPAPVAQVSATPPPTGPATPAVPPATSDDVRSTGGGLSWPAVAAGAILAVALIALALRRASRAEQAERAAADDVPDDVPEDAESDPTTPGDPSAPEASD
jgi:hypothetical protein